MGTEPLGVGEGRPDAVHFCREIETYLCRKNDGHLIRVVGPSFELVAGWADKGIPLKIAFEGIDRYFERYYRKGPRRRPVKIDFCEADVLDVFDEWKRAIGLSLVDSRQSLVDSQEAIVESRHSAAGSRSSLPAHLERVVRRLTSARATGMIGEGFDAIIDRIARELDAARAEVRGLRGERRRELVDRLNTLDRELLAAARNHLDDASLRGMRVEAERELSAFRASMPVDAFGRALDAAVDRLVRERFGLPVVVFA